MTGRNWSRRNFGRRGGRGFKTKNNDGRRKASTKQTLAYFTFYVSSAKQASDYKNTALFVINHINKDLMEAKIFPKLYGRWSTKIKIIGIQF